MNQNRPLWAVLVLASQLVWSKLCVAITHYQYSVALTWSNTMPWNWFVLSIKVPCISRTFVLLWLLSLDLNLRPSFCWYVKNGSKMVSKVGLLTRHSHYLALWWWRVVDRYTALITMVKDCLILRNVHSVSKWSCQALRSRGISSPYHRNIRGDTHEYRRCPNSAWWIHGVSCSASVSETG